MLILEVDPANSKIEFTVKHFRIDTVRGRFESFEGRIDMAEGDPPGSYVEGTVDPASIKTGIGLRDASLRARSFFDVARFPKISFRSTRVKVLPGDDLEIYGELTIRDVTREVVFDVRNKGEQPAVDGKRRWAFDAGIVLNRKDYDLKWNPLVEIGNIAVGEEVTGIIELQFVEA